MLNLPPILNSNASATQRPHPTIESQGAKTLAAKCRSCSYSCTDTVALSSLCVEKSVSNEWQRDGQRRGLALSRLFREYKSRRKILGGGNLFEILKFHLDRILRTFLRTRWNFNVCHCSAQRHQRTRMHSFLLGDAWNQRGKKQGSALYTCAFPT
jgi:hypothetical protein